ncbi:MAG: hypothetical protein J6C63_05045 [Lachnospiraceae bacterium]|nr:hypothetical protein [Lachnospiraceae bacterium]
MSEEFKDNLEVTEDAVEEYIPETVHEEPVIEIEAEVQPEAVLTQAEDGSWRHAENSPFSPFYIPDKKQKNNNRLTIGLIILLLVLLVGCLIFVVSKLIEAAASEATVAWNKSTEAVGDFFDGIKDSFTEEEKVPDTGNERDIEESPDILLPQEPESPDNYEDYVEDFLKRYYENEYGYDDYDDSDDYDDGDEYYEPSPDDDYYVELADYLRDDLSYSVEFEEYTHSDFENSVYISVWYAQVSDDVKNSETINEYLMDGALYYASMFEEDYTEDLSLEIESFVTYMDEETLSVVVYEYVYLEGDVLYDLYCMNFDLKTGTLLDNTSIIEVSDELVDAFVDQSIYQNGYTSSVSDYTSEEIADFMRDEDSLILFYTPVGLEIGYNHPNGWVTATLKDYQRFLKKL